MPLTEEQLCEIEAELRAATPGPWESVHDIRPDVFAWVKTANGKGGYFNGGQIVTDRSYGQSDDGTKHHIAELAKYEQNGHDADFIAHAPENIRALLDSYRELQAQVSALQAENEKLTARLARLRKYEEAQRFGDAMFEKEAKQ